jgi:hypothetical protein
MRHVIGLPVLSLSLFAAACAFSVAAYAWSSDGKGNITCSDGSSAVAAKGTDDNWTVTKAGNKGSIGGSFPTEGKAALYACGE